MRIVKINDEEKNECTLKCSFLMLNQKIISLKPAFIVSFQQCNAEESVEISLKFVLKIDEQRFHVPVLLARIRLICYNGIAINFN